MTSSFSCIHETIVPRVPPTGLEFRVDVEGATNDFDHHDYPANQWWLASMIHMPPKSIKYLRDLL